MSSTEHNFGSDASSAGSTASSVSTSAAATAARLSALAGRSSSRTSSTATSPRRGSWKEKRSAAQAAKKEKQAAKKEKRASVALHKNVRSREIGQAQADSVASAYWSAVNMRRASTNPAPPGGPAGIFSPNVKKRPVDQRRAAKRARDHNATVIYVGVFEQANYTAASVRHQLAMTLSFGRKSSALERKALNDIDIDGKEAYAATSRRLQKFELIDPKSLSKGWPHCVPAKVIWSLRDQLFSQLKNGSVQAVDGKTLALLDSGGSRGSADIGGSNGLGWSKEGCDPTRMVFFVKGERVWVAWTTALMTTQKAKKMLEACAEALTQARATACNKKIALGGAAGAAAAAAVAAPPRRRKVKQHKSGADEALSKLTHGAEEAMEAAAKMATDAASLAFGTERLTREQLRAAVIDVIEQYDTPDFETKAEKSERIERETAGIDTSELKLRGGGASGRTSGTVVKDCCCNRTNGGGGRPHFCGTLFGVGVALFLILSFAVAAIVLTIMYGKGKQVMPTGAIALASVGEAEKSNDVVDLAQSLAAMRRGPTVRRLLKAKLSLAPFREYE